MSIEIKKNDSDVRELSNASKSMLKALIAEYDLSSDVQLYETSYGHVAHLKRKPGRFVPGLENQPARMNKDDFEFLNNLPGFRWVELATDNIKIGFENLKDTSESQGFDNSIDIVYVKVAEFRRLIEKLERLFHVGRHSCVGDREKFDWQTTAEKVLAELRRTESKRAKSEDKNDKLKICAAVSTYLLNNKISKPI